MPTSFPINAAGVYSSGEFWDAPNPASGSGGSRPARVGKGQGFQIDFVATGTDLSLSCYPYATAPVYTVSVDGGPATNITLPANGAWGTATLFSALADAAHTVSIKHASGSPDNLWLDFNGALSLSGAAPAVSGPAGFGAIHKIGVNPYIALEGGWNFNLSGSYYNWPHLLQNTTDQVSDAKIRFRATCTGIKLWMLGQTCYLRLWVDGVPQGTAPVVAANNGVYGWVTIASGLDGANEHEYAVSVDGGTINALLVMAVGGTINTSYSFPGPRGAIVAIGDSITQGTLGTSNASCASWLSRLAASKNRQAVNLGVNGQWLISTPAGVGIEDRLWADLGELRSKGASLDYVLFLPGHNDATNNVSTSDFQSAVSASLSRINEILPAAKILCLGILPTSQTPAATNRAALNAAMSAAVSGSGIANASYVSTDNWLTVTSSGAAFDTLDGVHPTGGTLAGQTGDGSAKIIAQLSPLITSWSAAPPCTPPPTPTLSVADKGDGTGATATITGGDAGASNAVYVATAPIAGGVNVGWTLAATIAGNGSAALALANGFYVARAIATENSLTSLPSNEPAFTTTGGAASPTTPSGPIAVPKSQVRDMIAASATFQARTGLPTQAAAYAKVFRTFVRREDDEHRSLRPYATILTTPDLRYLLDSGGDKNYLLPQGAVGVLISDNDRYPEDINDSSIDFENFLGGVMVDLEAQAAVQGNLAVIEIELVAIRRLPEEIERAQGIWWEGLLLVKWQA